MLLVVVLEALRALLGWWAWATELCVGAAHMLRELRTPCRALASRRRPSRHWAEAQRRSWLARLWRLRVDLEQHVRTADHRRCC